MGASGGRAADRLAGALEELGGDRLFCVPGESYLALLDALRDRGPEVVVCRHEGGAGMMAVADAKLTGRPGLLAVSRGPGAANAAIALHLAQQDAVPLLCLVGQVARHERGRGAFQEVDYARMFGGICKGVWEVTDGAHLAETVARAWTLALAGTPGPVLVALPEDMLHDRVEGASPLAPPLPPRTGPDAEALERAAAMLARAERPLVIAGGGLAAPEGRRALRRLAERHRLPVALAFKYQEIFPNDSPLFAGHLGFKSPPSLVRQLGEADLVLAIGTRLGDVPTQGWRLPLAPEPRQPLIHVWPDAAVLGSVYRTALPVPCDPARFAAALAETPPRAGRAPDWADACNAAARALAAIEPRPRPDGLEFGAVVRALAAQAPPGTIVVTDSGNFSGWVHQCWPWDGETPAVGAAGGAMGLGVPGAVAASLRHPEACVLCFVGDGGLLMTGAELATARATGARPRIVVSDNRTYGTIRLHQERDHPGRVYGTDLVNPDFAAWAASFGALGLALGPGDDVDAAVARLLAHHGPALLSVRASAEAISPFTTITALRERARG